MKATELHFSCRAGIGDRGNRGKSAPYWPSNATASGLSSRERSGPTLLSLRGTAAEIWKGSAVGLWLLAHVMYDIKILFPAFAWHANACKYLHEF
jgi:hypothetical protein